MSEESDKREMAPDQWEAFKRGLNEAFMNEKREWAGPPIPISDTPLILEKRHPNFKTANGLYFAEDGQLTKYKLKAEDAGYRIINSWYNRPRQRRVVIYEDRKTKERGILMEDESAYERLTCHLKTIGAVQMAWEIEAEATAQRQLANLVNRHQFKCYFMTGSFLETSKYSKITYVFRRLRPTIALRSRDEGITCLAVLCLHPIGYYGESFAGTMVPTDDVIAHLVMMRGDEHFFWRKANHHSIHEARAGV